MKKIITLKNSSTVEQVREHARAIAKANIEFLIEEDLIDNQIALEQEYNRYTIENGVLFDNPCCIYFTFQQHDDNINKEFIEEYQYQISLYIK